MRSESLIEKSKHYQKLQTVADIGIDNIALLISQGHRVIITPKKCITYLELDEHDKTKVIRHYNVLPGRKGEILDVKLSWLPVEPHGDVSFKKAIEILRESINDGNLEKEGGKYWIKNVNKLFRDDNLYIDEGDLVWYNRGFPQDRFKESEVSIFPAFEEETWDGERQQFYEKLLVYTFIPQFCQYPQSHIKRVNGPTPLEG